MSTDITIDIEFWPDDVVARIEFHNILTDRNYRKIQAKNIDDLFDQCKEQVRLVMGKNNGRQRI